MQIKYTGLSDVRQISKRDWKLAGVDDGHALVWDASNNWIVSADELSEQELQLLKQDEELKFVGDDDGGYESTDAATALSEGTSKSKKTR